MQIPNSICARAGGQDSFRTWSVASLFALPYRCFPCSRDFGILFFFRVDFPLFSLPSPARIHAEEDEQRKRKVFPSPLKSYFFSSPDQSSPRAAKTVFSAALITKIEDPFSSEPRLFSGRKCSLSNSESTRDSRCPENERASLFLVLSRQGLEIN